jgi:hypothetical protein
MNMLHPRWFYWEGWPIHWSASGLWRRVALRKPAPDSSDFRANFGRDSMIQVQTGQEELDLHCKNEDRRQMQEHWICTQRHSKGHLGHSEKIWYKMHLLLILTILFSYKGSRCILWIKMQERGQAWFIVQT